jgi:predicted esterase
MDEQIALMPHLAGSALVFREIAEAEGTAERVVIAIHDAGTEGSALIPLLRDLRKDSLLIFPQGPRPASPTTYYGREHGLYSWYIDNGPGVPEPITFCEALCQIEQLVFDIRDRPGPPVPIFILGIGQGATLAIGISAFLSDMLAGIVAIDGYLPRVRGWNVEPPEQGFPALLMRCPDGGIAEVEWNMTIDHFASSSAKIAQAQQALVFDAEAPCGVALTNWLRERRGHEERTKNG